MDFLKPSALLGVYRKNIRARRRASSSIHQHYVLSWTRGQVKPQFSPNSPAGTTEVTSSRPSIDAGLLPVASAPSGTGLDALRIGASAVATDDDHLAASVITLTTFWL